jgi:anthranilate synthase component 1
MSHYRPNLEEFTALAEQATTVPVYRQIFGDSLTPVSAFARVKETTEHAFLLESVVGGENIARYSFIAANPQTVFEARGDAIRIERGGQEETRQSNDPLQVLEELLASYRAVHLPELPPFVGGAVGYAAYDMVRYYEHLPDAPPDDRDLPDLLFGIYDSMVIFDNVRKTVKVVCHGHVHAGDPEKAYKEACGRIDELIETLSQPRVAEVSDVDPDTMPTIAFSSNMERGEFESAVEACKEYIRAGDIFQVVLSQRLCVETEAHPFNIYRALRIVNPSPFMFYLKMPYGQLVGSSPEIMCRVQDGVVVNRPLAGTRRRGRNEQEDKELETEMLADPKERAEHIMLVDLGRNDVGRVAELGSVELTDVMTVERYSHVMHISSNVTGKLAAGKTAFDALRATLPVGTVSGAPKIRAMEIIDEFETTRRGPYAGAVGYIDFAGNMDTCIALRTLVVTPGPGGCYRVYIQAGAGIVADSVPELEYQETINKAKGLLRAIEIAQSEF